MEREFRLHWRKYVEEKGLTISKYAQYSNEYTKQRYLWLRKKVISILGGKCANCGNVDLRCLQIDHIKAVGSKRKTPYEDFKKIIKGETDNFQILCANCNAVKKHDKKEFPNMVRGN